MKSPSLHTYHVVIENGKKIFVSDCKSIAEYSDEKIVLKLSRSCVTVIGSELTLSDFYGDEAEIRGNIISVDLKKDEVTR